MFVNNVFFNVSILSIYYILAENFAAVLWCTLVPPQSDYLIACRCVELVAELAAAAASHLNDVPKLSQSQTNGAHLTPT